MPSWEDSKRLDDLADPYWYSYFRKHFGDLTVAVFSMKDHMEFQRKKWGDFILVLDFEEPSIFKRVEVKTQSEQNYWKHKTREYVLFETIANVEKGSAGSSFFETKAEIYAIGYLVQQGYETNPVTWDLLDPGLFWVKETQLWLRPLVGTKYRELESNTSELYHTKFVLVPLEDIPDSCICRAVGTPRLSSLWDD